ncbi:MAG: hypothetical protein ACP5O7_11190 [Phycisphaerae bacterium]
MSRSGRHYRAVLHTEVLGHSGFIENRSECPPAAAMNRPGERYTARLGSIVTNIEEVCVNAGSIDKGSAIKLGLAVALLVVAVIWLVLHWGAMFGRVADKSIAVFQVPHQVGVDPTEPIGQNNPADSTAKGMYIAYDFASEQGKLWIYVHPNDPTYHMTALFQERLSRRRPPQWVTQLRALSDPVDRAIFFAARRGLGGLDAWLRSAGATSEQMAKVKTAWGVYHDWLVLFNQQQHDGTAAPNALAAMEQAFAAYQKTPGDIFKDRAKQQAARQVYAAGMTYVDHIDALRNKHMKQLSEAIKATLNDTQKTGLTDAINKLLNRYPPG